LQSTSIVKLYLDTTSCPIRQPTNDSEQYEFYESNKSRHTLKYEIGFSIATENICWCSGGWPGRQSDVTIARTSGIFSNLLPGELIIADKAYFGVEHCLTSFRPCRTELEDIWDRLIKQKRQIQERFHGRLKRFNFTTVEWRHQIHDHHIVFNLLTHIVALDIFFRPLNRQ